MNIKIKQIDLIKYAKEKYHYKCNEKGDGHCPLPSHAGTDTHPSFSIYVNKKKTWAFKCHTEGLSGSIIDLVQAMEKITTGEAISRLETELNQSPKNRHIEREHIYRDAAGKPIRKKIKYRNDSQGESWLWMHLEKNGEWEAKKGDYEEIPYNLYGLTQSKNEEVIICEGEKDSDTVTALGPEFLSTSAPNGKSSWPDDITKHFPRFKKITFLYDVGNDSNAIAHAKILKDAFPKIRIYIGGVPLTEREADITDYLDTFANTLAKKKALCEILEKAKELNHTPKPKRQEPRVETISEIMSGPEITIDHLINPYVERNGFTLIGGVKGVGKSLFLLNLGLYFASRKSPFLDGSIAKAGKFLLIQQEVNRIGLKIRIQKILQEEEFDHQNRFQVITTTGSPFKLPYPKDYDKIRKLIDDHEPDILALDPLSTFNPSENKDTDMAIIVDKLNQLKTEFPIAVVVAHHFSSKGNAEDPRYPNELGGKFRGHSRLSDAADVLIGLTRLPPQQKRQTLPLPYENYCIMETETRHGEKPRLITIERRTKGLIFRPSNIFSELGKKIMPGEIQDLLKKNNGKMLLKEIYEFYKGKAHFNTVHAAIQELEKQGQLRTITMPGRGAPKLLELQSMISPGAHMN